MTGYVHYYYGDGKGKTTAAMGLALRAAGCGLRVLVVQFLKSRKSGEVAALEALGVRVLRGKGSGKFLRAMDDDERATAGDVQQGLFCAARTAALAGEVDLLVLDEVADACRAGMVPTDDVCRLLQKKPQSLEVVMTGHTAAPELAEHASYVSHIKKEKHPYDRGVAAREGIEF